MAQTRLLALGLFFPWLLAGPAQAASVPYLYATGSVFIETRGPSEATVQQRLFSPETTLSGSFVYDNAGSLVLPGPPSGLAYDAISNLAGQVGAFSFFDPAGRVIVNNEGVPVGSELVDALTISAQPPGATSGLDGFTITAGDLVEFQLVNVRLFWIEGDFLGSDNALPATLPPPGALMARAALDFRAVADEFTTHTVFFQPLGVTIVPLSATAWLLLTALGSLAGLRRVRLSLVVGAASAAIFMFRRGREDRG